MEEIKNTFHTDIRKLLHLIIGSLYSDRDVFLRELLSNASDAIDKCWYILLKDTITEDIKYEIVLDTDRDAHILYIQDNGIGMNREDLIENLSTIAHSGTDDWRQMLDNKESVSNLIGKFGVGFFSAFLVAQRIKVITRKYNEQEAYEWESDGLLEYTIRPTEVEWSHGTKIELHLKDEHLSFLDTTVLQQTVEKYSQYICCPIRIKGVEEKFVHKKAIWKKSASECSEEEYAELFKSISNIHQKPAHRRHFMLDGGRHELSGILFINPQPSVYGPLSNKKIKIYANNVLVMDTCPVELMPDWMNFVCGVIETNQDSLHVSRESFKNDESVKQLRTIIRKQVCALLNDFFTKDREGYKQFYDNFSKHMKWAVNDDERRLESILLWKHSCDDRTLVTFDEYAEKIPEPTGDILFITGHSVEEMKTSVFIQPYLNKEQCVLLLDEPIDEFLMQKLNNYNGHALVDITKEDAPTEDTEQEEFLKKIQVIVDDENIQSVRYTNCLDSMVDAARVVSLKTGWSAHMENIMKAQPLHERRIFDLQKGQRILEINPSHPLVVRLRDRFEENDEIPEENVKIMYDLALLRSGFNVKNLPDFTTTVYRKLIETEE